MLIKRHFPLALALIVSAFQCATAAADDARQQLLDAAARYEALREAWPFEAEYLFGNPEMVDPALAARCVAELRPVMDQVRAALGAEPGGWEANPLASTMVAGSPEQNALRSLHKAMHMDIAYRIHTGNLNGVNDDFVNLLQLNGLAQQEGGVMSSASGLATIISTTSLIEERALASGALTPEQCAELNLAIEDAVGDDSFGFGSALATERDEIVNMLSEEGEQAFDDLVEARMFAGDEETIAALTGLSEDSMTAATAGYEAAMSQFITLCGDFSDPGAKPRLEKLIDEIQGGGYGPVAAAFAPRFNLAGLVFENIAIVRETQATLEAIASGAVPASDAMNAAFFYRMAIEKLDELPGEAWREIEWHASLDPPAMEAVEFEKVAAWSEILDLLGKACEIERCEFMTRHDRIRNGLWPHVEYLDGMNRCAMMVTSAMNLARSREEGDRTAELAADLLILIDHITQEKLVEHSERAVAMIEFVEPSLVAAIQFLPRSELQAISAALERLEEIDPFEYESSRGSYSALVKQSLRPRPDPTVWFSQAEWVINRAPDSWLTLADVTREALHEELRALAANDAQRAAGEIVGLVEPDGGGTLGIEPEEFALPSLVWLIQQPIKQIEVGAATTHEVLMRLDKAIE